MSCTLFPDGCWAECCKRHDTAYALQNPKLEADMQLYRCVKAKRHRIIAVVMLVGVVAFGWVNYIIARYR